MDEMLKNAAARTPMSRAHVLALWERHDPYSSIAERTRQELCESHERLRMELEAATKAAEEINQMLQQVAK